ncbi:MAG: hypothetical protein HY698_00285 [Deltaproteobacteria bacterium]|nr:hypothetical protein [Deltaproteobacteria bacterium]
MKEIARRTSQAAPRVQAFEFNDLSACPRFLRESIIESLGNGLRWGRVFDGVGPVFADFCRRAGCESVLDLCSGSGEPVSMLLEALARQGLPPVRFVLSDLLPNTAAMERVSGRHPGLVEVTREPVDATCVPTHLDRPARTIINALHHFPPDVAARLIADAVAKRRALFIVESFPRSLARMAATLPALGIAALANPFLTPQDRWLKAFSTYAVPLVPVIGLWDAAVSALRIHDQDDLRAMAARASAYDWEYREIPFFPGGRAMAFFGIPL